jgi:hypothetical protein
MRLITAEMAKLSSVAYRTMQDIEQQRSEGSVQTMNRIFGMLGLKLAVARISRELYAPDRVGNSTLRICLRCAVAIRRHAVEKS